MIRNLIEKYSDTDDFNSIIQEMVRTEKLIPKGGVQQKGQKVGNCSLASIKAAVGVLCLLYTGFTSDKDWGASQSQKIQKMSGKGNEAYKRYTTYLREVEFTNYLQAYLQTSPSSPLDLDLFNKITGKLKKESLLNCRKSLEKTFPNKKEEIKQIFSTIKQPQKPGFFSKIRGAFQKK